MAKQTTEKVKHAPVTPVTEDTEVKTGELVPQGSQALAEAIPDFIPVGDNTGSENITKDDLQMPRLAIAQAMSPQKLEANAAFIEGLRLGEMFNTLTSHIYGKGPLEFVIIRNDRPRWVEFDEDRNMIDPKVPFGDERTLWRTSEDGERLPPVATQFYDYIVVLLPSMEILAMSMSKTNIRAAKKLNGLIATRIPPVPLYARRFMVDTALETNDKGTYGIFSVRSAGDPRVPNSDLIRDRLTFDACKALHDQFKDAPVIIDVTDDHDDTSFDTAAMDAQAASTPGM